MVKYTEKKQNHYRFPLQQTIWESQAGKTVQKTAFIKSKTKQKTPRKKC